MILTHICPASFIKDARFRLKLQKTLVTNGVIQKIEIFIGSRISKFLCPAQRYDDFKLINGIFVKFKKPAKLLSSYLPVSPSRVLRVPGSSLHHLVPKHLRATWPKPEQSHLMAPTRDDNARDKQSVLCLNPAIFLRDFTLYMTTNYAIIWKKCLNYITCLTHICPASFIKDARFRLKLQKTLVTNGLIIMKLTKYCVKVTVVVTVSDQWQWVTVAMTVRMTVTVITG